MQDQINFGDFMKVEMRVGTVVEASIPEGSEHLIQLSVDFGEEVGKRTIFTGILKWYKPEDLKGKQFVFVLNLPPKKMSTFGESQGMIMAVVPMVEGKETAVLLAPLEKVADGTRVR